MDPVTILTLANAALSFVKEAIPQIQQLANKGVITAEQQQATMDAYKALKAQVESGPFTGPEWQVTP